MSEDFLSCSVCLETFNDHKRAPLLLTCGHTFCADCIKSMLASKLKIRCPNCNKEDSRNPKDMSKNYLITDIVLKLAYSQPTKEDPWLCRIHPAETIIYLCQKTKKLLCCECLHLMNYTDLIEISQKEVDEKISMFKGLYEIASPHDLKERGRFSGLLSESLECQKLRILQHLDDLYAEMLENINNHFKSAKSKIQASIEKEQEKFADLNEVLCTLGGMKMTGIKIEDMLKVSKLNKAHKLITSLSGISDMGSSTEIKKLGNSPIEFSFKLEIPPKLVNVAASIVECPINLVKGITEASDIGEKKMSRFNLPNNRWGIFEGRNQIEAVTFSVNQKIYITGVGIGNAYHPGKTVKLEKFSLLDGGSTMSPVAYEDTGIDLTYEANGAKIVKIQFKRYVELKENSDYTIKLVLRGGAGVFRGGSTTRSRNGDGGLVFKFKNAVYSGDDVKNGENADDGPIFDIYYKTVIESLATVSFTRFNSMSGTQTLKEQRLPYVLTFTFNKPISLTSFSVPAPASEDSSLLIKRVEILKGPPSSSVSIYTHTQKIEVPFNPSLKIAQILLDQVVPLESSCFYSIIIELSSPNVHNVSELLTPKVSCNNIIMTTAKIYVDSYIECSELPVILMLQGSSIENLNNFAKIVVPENFLEDSSGEMKIKRFESFDQPWNLNTEGQIECFSFSFSEDVLVTALGLGNCATTNGFISVEALQILFGDTSASPAIYEHSRAFSLINSDDENPVVKIRLESPVKIEKEKKYTFKVVMRGEGKAFKGKGFLGQSISKDGVVFQCFKVKLRENDKQNGDNESGGPIFDVYFLSMEKSVSVESFNAILAGLYPKNKQEIVQQLAEYKVCRYNNTGSSWHVNTDGKQIEAISFKPSTTVKLVAIGIGNAHETGKKVGVKKIQVKEGKSTKGKVKVYKHKEKVKLINVGEESKFVRVALESPVVLSPENWYTLMVKYKPGVPVCRGTMANNHPSVNGVTFTFEKTRYEGADVENGSHEVHGPLRDFYFTLN